MTRQSSVTSQDFQQLLWLPVLLLAACLTPWGALLSQMAINHDIYWEMWGVKRLWQGGTFTSDFYDNNPPLSVLVYYPAVFLSYITGLSAYAANAVATSFYCLLSAYAVQRLASYIIGREGAFCLALCLLIASTIPVLRDFGQRDQFLVLGLIPFVLGQIILTEKIECPRQLLWASLAAGAVLVLLKPHFGLIPVWMMCRRMVQQKKFWGVIRDPDFISLSVAVPAYIAVIWVFFRDYATNIFPDVLQLYAFPNCTLCYMEAAVLLLLYIIYYTAHRCLHKDQSLPISRLLTAFLEAAALCLIPYLVAGRLWQYHLIPSLSFAWLAAGLILFSFLRRHIALRAALMAVIVVLCAVGYSIAALYPPLKRSEVLAQPLTKVVKECGADCRFMLFTTRVTAAKVTAYYTGADHVSRFPSFWFKPELEEQTRLYYTSQPTRLNIQQLSVLYAKYVGYIGEDLRVKKPDLVFVCNNFNLGFFRGHPSFMKEWRAYSQTGSFVMDWPVYYRSTSFYDSPGVSPDAECAIYKRMGK